MLPSHLLAGVVKLGMRYPLVFLRLSALLLALAGLIALATAMNRQGLEERAALMLERRAVFGPEGSGYNPDFAFWRHDSEKEAQE